MRPALGEGRTARPDPAPRHTGQGPARAGGREPGPGRAGREPGGAAARWPGPRAGPDEAQHAQRHVQHFGQQRPAQHLPDPDEGGHAQQVGAEEQPAHQRSGQQPAQVEGVAFDPGGGKQEQQPGPQAFDAAAGQIDLGDAAFKDQDGIDAEGGESRWRRSHRATSWAVTRRMG